MLSLPLLGAPAFSDEPEQGETPGVGSSREPATEHRRMLLVDDQAIPDAWVVWTASGETIEREGARPFAAPDDVEPFDGCNVSSSVSLGGTRLETGAGHPNGAILRVELRKTDLRRAFFRGVDPGTVVRFGLRGVRFNQPVRVEPDTTLVHLRYSEKDVEACSLPPEASSQFLLADPRDTLGGMVRAGENATPGGLSGRPGLGRCEAVVEDDGTVSFWVEIPFGLLRHLQDPWASDLPGTFFEPIRLHAEVEVLPAWAEPIERDHPPLDKPYERPTIGESAED